MLNMSGSVLIEDEVLRDGLQNETARLSTDEKLALIAGLEAAGVRRIQVGSFVHPDRVPQMADTDELFRRMMRQPGVTYTALILNRAGLDRALAVGVPHLSMSVSASETHSRKNLNRSVDEARAALLPTIAAAQAAGIKVRAGIQSAFGCGFEGRVDPARVLDIVRSHAEAGVDEINLADTAGLGNPRQVHDLCREAAAVIEAAGSAAELSLHLHDTRGLGLANMVAGLAAGVRIFDAALGGLGGCPFIPRATGNIATEDTVFALDEMGIETGIDWRALAALTRGLEAKLGRQLPGKMAHVRQPGDAAA